MDKPLLSIVIANYNYGRFLDEAIRSIVSQNMGDRVELIVCDAASTDNSVDIIKKYAKGLPPNISYYDWANSANHNLETAPLITWWCSEPDGGQSAAFNKGFSHAHGRFLTWLNADDVLLPGTLKKLESATDSHPTCEWFVGGCFWLDPQMRIINCGRGRHFSEIRYREGNVSVWGPSSFFTKNLLNAVGGVDERFHFSMDSDLWLRFACKAHARYRPFCDYAWGLRLHPDAKMSGHNFTEDGRLDVSHNNDERIKQNIYYNQIDKESQWMAEYFPSRRGNFVSRILSISIFRVVAAKMDLLRYKNHYYMEYFG